MPDAVGDKACAIGSLRRDATYHDDDMMCVFVRDIVGHAFCSPRMGAITCLIPDEPSSSLGITTINKLQLTSSTCYRVTKNLKLDL